MQSKIIAPYVIRAYVWQLLKANVGLSDSMYDVDGNGRGLVPIVPLGEEPELQAFDKPYLVYGFAESPSRTPNLMIGNIMFVVYSSKFSEMSEVTNVISKSFEDEFSVRNVNDYSSTIPDFLGLRFTDISVASVEGGTPEDEEGGRVSALVNLRYEYTSTYSTPLITKFV